MNKSEALRMDSTSQNVEEQIKEMESFVSSFFNSGEDKLRNADKETKDRYKYCVEFLCSQDNIIGLRAKAYGCYGKGNGVYTCDWQTSEACLLKLVELDNDAWAANTLGYIYYYGRTTNNEPDYEKAFKYFSVAALYGIHEAMYKIADLCLKGKGVPMKCLRGAENIMSWLYYDEVKPRFMRGEFGGKLADVALRMGNIMLAKAQEKGDVTDKAYSFYLEAENALKLRAKYDYYGDSSVMSAIRKGLEQAREGLSFKAMEQGEREFKAVLKLLQNIDADCKLSLKLKAKGKAAVLTVVFPKRFTDCNKGLYEVLPQIDCCGFFRKVKIDVAGIKKLKCLKKSFIADYVYEEKGWLIFGGYNDAVYCKIKADSFKLRRKGQQDGAEKLYQLVSVEYTEGGRLYDYLYELNTAVAEGEQVVVASDVGETVVTVRKVFMAAERELGLPIDKYKKVLRKVL